MPIRRATLMAIMLSFFVISPASAEQIGDVGYYRVAHVADDDMLMVRAKPSAAADQIGSFGPHSKPIEVFETQDGWAKVSINGRTGWVSMAHLAPFAPRKIERLGLPQGLQCLGTEPFWNADFSEGEMTLSGVETASGGTMAIKSSQTAKGRNWPLHILLDDGKSSVLVTPKSCSDGMSDAHYGWRATFMLHKAKGVDVLSGCCHVRPESE